MRRNVILITILTLFGLIALFVLWRAIYVAPHKVQIEKKRVPKPHIAKKRGLPPIIKKFEHPEIAVVIDDFGYNMNNVDELFGINEAVTLSILPGLPFSRRIADLAYSHGYEVILHLPLEAHRKDVREEVDTIKSGMSEAEVIERLKRDIAGFSHLRGVSNHMGSKATEDRDLMTTIFNYLKRNKLYFFDSLTSQKSVCRQAAAAVGIPYARRDVFLDIPYNDAYIEKQILELRRMAFRKGRAIAVCHDRKNTILVLARMMPEMASEGVRFVFLSELVNK